MAGTWDWKQVEEFISTALAGYDHEAGASIDLNGFGGGGAAKASGGGDPPAPPAHSAMQNHQDIDSTCKKCKRKRNAKCQYGMCKVCCNKENNNCDIHLRSTKRVKKAAPQAEEQPGRANAAAGSTASDNGHGLLNDAVPTSLPITLPAEIHLHPVPGTNSYYAAFVIGGYQYTGLLTLQQI